jgi:hypothetical protein
LNEVADMVGTASRAWHGRLAAAAAVIAVVGIVGRPASRVLCQEASEPPAHGDAASNPQSLIPNPSSEPPARGSSPAAAEPETKAKPAAEREKPETPEKPAKPAEAAPGGSWLEAQNMSGSSAESEQAVNLALAWLAEHQLANGAWSFDHRLGRCQGRCSDPGSGMAKAVNGATGMALLPFIDHGNTHQAGNYRQNVAAGLQFLIARMGKDGSLWEQGGTMYSHALGLLALCEDLRVNAETLDGSSEFSSASSSATRKQGTRSATGHTRPNPNAGSGRQTAQKKKGQQAQQQGDPLDRLVPAAAARALAFTLTCQDPRRGGWRYGRGQPGDISVTGWHVMALHSATAVGLPIPALTTRGAVAFLDSVQSNYGATYGYMEPHSVTPTRTSIGLLCRVYTGWNRPQLQRGVELLAAVGPSERDMYYNYYGTLLLHHYGGPLWDEWNRKLRDYLIRTQSHQGHETGSWSFRPNSMTSAAGRHFDTCMACLILETYYRSKPAYPPPQPDKLPAAWPKEKPGDAKEKPAEAKEAPGDPKAKPAEAPPDKAAEPLERSAEQSAPAEKPAAVAEKPAAPAEKPAAVPKPDDEY